MKKLAVAYVANNTYGKFLPLSLYSLLEYNQDIFLSIHIFMAEAWSQENRASVKKIVYTYTNVELQLHSIDQDVFKGLVPHNGNYATYAKILAPFTLKEFERILYLDVDVVCNGSIAEFCDIVFEGNDLAGCLDLPYVLSNTRGIFVKNRLKRLSIMSPIQYINAGIMLFDARRIREDQSLQGYVDFGIETQKYYLGYDQDLTNIYFHKRIKILPRKFNYLAEMRLAPKKPNFEPLLIHGLFPKPWQITKHDFWVESIYHSLCEKVNEILDIKISPQLIDDSLIALIRNNKFPHYGAWLWKRFPVTMMKTVLFLEGRKYEIYKAE
jgi:lipopolysaccharide biosynthesis glycosyltransferase